MLFPILFQIWYEIFPEAEQTVGIAVTVTTQVPEILLPSVDVAVIDTLPGTRPETNPLLSTVAITGSPDDHVSVLLVALFGRTVAGISMEEPAAKVEVIGRLTEVTNVG